MSDCPEWLETAISRTMADYNPGQKTDYSSTSLISPAMILHLKKTFGEGEQNPLALLPSFFGTAIHNQIENKLKGVDKYIVEERLYTEIEGFVISCQIDLYNKKEKRLSDHKTTSVFKVNKEDHSEWEQQLNINRFIMIENGYEVDSLAINALILDWRRSESLRSPDYPQYKFKEVHIPLWRHEDTREFIVSRIRLHEAAKDGLVQPCSPEERWARPDSWAIYKKGASRAARVLYSPEEAHAYMEDKNLDRIEYRQGEDLRCKEYCANNFNCPYYKTRYINGNN